MTLPIANTTVEEAEIFLRKDQSASGLRRLRRFPTQSQSRLKSRPMGRSGKPYEKHRDFWCQQRQVVRLRRNLLPAARAFNLSRSPSGVTGVIDIAIDLSLDTASEALAETLLPQLGQVDVLIHNAAKLINDTLQSAESEALADVLNINVIAPQRLNQALVTLMSAGSAILYIGSTLSESVANSFSYVTSKHAMVGMMRFLSGRVPESTPRVFALDLPIPRC